MRVSAGRRQPERLAGVVRRRLGDAVDRADLAGVLAGGHPRGRGGPVLEQPTRRSRSLVMTSNATKCSRSWAGVTMPAWCVAVNGTAPLRPGRTRGGRALDQGAADGGRAGHPGHADAGERDGPPAGRCCRTCRDSPTSSATTAATLLIGSASALIASESPFRSASDSSLCSFQPSPSRCFASAVSTLANSVSSVLTSAGVALLERPGAAPRWRPWSPRRWR